MRLSLDQVNPTGRLDVLAFRIADRLAAPRIPEWPLIQPLAAEWLTKLLGPPVRKRRKAKRRK